MVDGISTNNNQPSGFSEFKKSPVVNYSQQNSSTQPNNDNIEITTFNKPAQQINKLQVASLIAGTLASSVLIAYFAKSSGIFGKNGKLLRQIKKADIPDFVRKKLLFEYDKFRKSDMDIDNSQNYIAHVLKLNWKKPEQKLIDIDKAKKILDEELIGMDNVKKELISYFKARNYNIRNNITNDEGSILCLQGPPGVAKTSVAEIVAKIMDKPFGRMSLGGESQASAIVGDKRVWKSSAPGKIIQLLQDAGTSDPVMLIDELDKAGVSREHGDPGSALLDVLEPKQCKNFTDRYLELPYDLSNVTFIVTANDLNRIPKVLQNRLSIINLKPYAKQTKFDICKAKISKKMEHLKIDSSKVLFRPDGIAEIVNQTFDEGARETLDNLKRVFNSVIDHLETFGSNEKIIVNKDFVQKALKNRKNN